MRSLHVAALLAAVSGRAIADEGARKLVVAVDETVELEVGYAIGFVCDDTTIVRGEMKSRSSTQNVFVATGLKTGTTQCRIGTDPNRPSTLYQVIVTPPRRR